MPTFPLKENDILALAVQIRDGLGANVVIYPNPTVSVANLTTVITNLEARRTLLVAARAAAESATTAKNSVLADLVDAMKADIRYAENVTNFNDDYLKLIGWVARAVATEEIPPGQPRILEAPRQGEGWVYLDWKEPIDGGKVAAYKIQRRMRPSGTWEDCGMSIETEITLINQNRNIELEYQVIPVNKSGEGPASNFVLAVM